MESAKSQPKGLLKPTKYAPLVVAHWNCTTTYADSQSQTKPSRSNPLQTYNPPLRCLRNARPDHISRPKPQRSQRILHQRREWAAAGWKGCNLWIDASRPLVRDAPLIHRSYTPGLRLLRALRDKWIDPGRVRLCWKPVSRRALVGNRQLLRGRKPRRSYSLRHLCDKRVAAGGICRAQR